MGNSGIVQGSRDVIEGSPVRVVDSRRDPGVVARSTATASIPTIEVHRRQADAAPTPPLAAAVAPPVQVQQPPPQPERPSKPLSLAVGPDFADVRTPIVRWLGYVEHMKVGVVVKESISDGARSGWYVAEVLSIGAHQGKSFAIDPSAVNRVSSVYVGSSTTRNTRYVHVATLSSDSAESIPKIDKITCETLIHNSGYSCALQQSRAST